MNNTKKLLMITICCALSSLLFSKYDEKQIMLQQANRYNFERKYSKSETIYENLTNKHPNDIGIFQQYINNLINQGKYKKALSIIDKKKLDFEVSIISEMRIMVFLKAGEIGKAKNVANKFFNNNKGRLQIYRRFANLFERFSILKQAKKLYVQARTVANDDNLFLYELANITFKLKEYDESIRLYTEFLKINRSYIYFVKRQINKMLLEDSTKISIIERYTKNINDNNFKDILGSSYLAVRKYEKALDIYERMTPEKVLELARFLTANKNYLIALKAFDIYKSKVESISKIADADIMKSKIFISLRKFDEAKKILETLEGNRELQSNRYRYKTNANKQCRELLAEIELRENGPGNKVLNYLIGVAKFSNNINERVSADFGVVHYKLMTKDYTYAKKTVNDIRQVIEVGSSEEAIANYYSYLISVMSNVDNADSLLVDLIIRIPQSDITTDALSLSHYLKQLNDVSKSIFLTGFRKSELYQYEEAIDTLMSGYKKSKNDIFLLFAGEIANISKNEEAVNRIYSKFTQSELLGAFAGLRLIENMSKVNDIKKNAADFLTENTSSVFSPIFRSILMKAEVKER